MGIGMVLGFGLGVVMRLGLGLGCDLGLAICKIYAKTVLFY